jgi:signal transduction histidine kinase
MSPTTRSTAAARREALAAEYGNALKGYLSGGGEAALREAYEIGRRSVFEGVGLPDLALLHHAALDAGGPRGRSPEELRAAGTFLAEAISPHEMARRGFQEASQALRQFNQILEREAARIAQTLHDETGQLLVAVQLGLATLAADAPAPLRIRVKEVTDLLQQVEEQLRTLSHTLRPPILDDLGLVPALEFLADRTSRSGGPSVRVEGAIEGRLPAPVEIAVYRVVHEALINARKHGRAREVRIRLERRGGWLRGCVRDDGRGFDAGLLATGKLKRGLGLSGMRERAKALGGTFEVDSQPGLGTEVRIAVPAEA